MGVTWTVPAALWLLLALPIVWIAPRFGRTNFNPRQRFAQAAVRSLLLAALVFAIARPVVATGSSRQSIVYLVDVSHSISGRAIEDAAKRIDDLGRDVKPAHSRIVAFGARAVLVDSTAALRQLAQVDAASPNVPALDRSESDLDAGLAAARAELAPGHVPRIILFTDGQPTAGDTGAAVARLAAEHVPVSVEPMAPRVIGDAWVDALDVPAQVGAGATFAAKISIASQRDAAGTIELRVNGKSVAQQSVTLAKGMTPVTVDAAIDAAGAHVIEAVLSVPNDPLVPNNSLSRAIWISPHPKVLYVEGTPSSAHYLSGALTQSGYEVSVRPPSALPATAAALDPWDVVILSDLARSSISDAAMIALTDWVEKAGGGLLVAGGESVYGEGGYRKTALERLTPVTFERKDEPEVALIIVLDRSWSMAGASMELCKSAAQAAVDVMTDEQSVGILTFNDQFDWDVPLRNVGKNRDSIRKKIAAIEPGGHTLIFPAVEQAYLALHNAKARAKHVILLSDGRSYPDDYEGLVKKMVEAKITVSSVAVGPAADAELLTDIAKWGKGRSYIALDPKDVPQIFVKEARNAVTPSFDEKDIKVVVKAPAFLEGVDLTRLPALKGRTATITKDTALELLTTDNKDPLLSFWPIGLGRTAVFASDVKDRWAANWVRWSGYGPFFTSIVRALERQRPRSLALDVTPGPIHGQARSVSMSIETRNPDGSYRDLLKPVIHVSAEGGTAVDLPARQVAPGRYEAQIVADAHKPLSISVAGEDPAIASRLIVPDPAAEYRFHAPNETLLRSIASATGGSWQPTPALLANGPGDHRTERRPVWTSLLVGALLLWGLDVLFRRIRVFEPKVAAEA